MIFLPPNILELVVDNAFFLGVHVNLAVFASPVQAPAQCRTVLGSYVATSTLPVVEYELVPVVGPDAL